MHQIRASVRTAVRIMEAGLREMLTMGATVDWVKAMRVGLRGQNGEGWTCREIREHIQISVRFEDGQRTTVVTDLPWVRSSQADLLKLAAQLKLQMTKGLGLKEAYSLTGSNEAHTTDGEFDWTLAAGRFRSHKVDGGATQPRTYNKMYEPAIRQVLAALEKRPRPINAKTLLDRLVKDHGGAPGSEGRRRRIQYAAQFLSYAVEQLAADGRWAPPRDLKYFVGIKPKGKTLTTFAKDDQIVRLLDRITNPRWRTAVGLVACFGLRGVELAHISPNGGFLHCAYRKRTERNPEGTAPRDIVGLDPKGLEGLSSNLLAILEEHGNEALPDTCFLRDADGELTRAGHALSQYLRRNRTWQALVAETAALPTVGATGNELVPYSLRHAYAARAHEEFGFSPRKTAGLMGHSLLTHSTTYGGQIDREILDTAQQQAAAVVAARMQAVG